MFGMLISNKTDASQSNHRDLSLANRNQSRSQQNYNPYIHIIITYIYIYIYICRTSVLGKPVNTGKPLAVGKPSMGRKTYVRLEGTYM